MGMVVRTNVMAVNAYRQLGMNTNQVSKSLEKLSSGFRINRAGDDASGLAISEKMKAQIRGLETASSNSQDGISLIQTAEGALTEVHDMLNRMVELAGKSANGTMDDGVDRAALQDEMNSLLAEIDRIAQGTNFNGLKLLDGALSITPASVTPGAQADIAIGANLTTGNVLGINTILAVGETPAQKTVFSIDLGNLAVQDGEVGDKLEFTIGGETFALTTTAADGLSTTEKIANALAQAINDTKADGTLKLAGTTDSGNAATVEAKAVKVGDTWTVEVTQLADPAAAADVIDANMTVAAAFTSAAVATPNSSLSGTTYNVGTIVNQQGRVATPAELGSTAFDLSSVAIADGSTITLGNQTFTFALGAAESKVDGTTISLTDTDAADYDKIGELLTKAAAGNGVFTVGYDNSTGNITLVEKVGQTIADLTTEEGFTDVIYANAAGTPVAAVGTGLILQVGDTADPFNKITVEIADMSAKGLGIAGLDISTQQGGSDALALIRGVAPGVGSTGFIGGAINAVSTQRAQLGALQNRLEHTINNLDVAAENITNANSRIRDTDMAKEMMEYTKMTVLTQAAQAMLAQATQQPQSILQLLQ